MTNAEFSTLDAAACVARQREIEARFAATKDDPNAKDERQAFRLELDAVVARLREPKEQVKAENMRRNIAGIGSPLHEACVAMLGADTVARLDADALARFAEREARTAARKAAKSGQVSTAPAPPVAIEPGSRPTSRPPEPGLMKRGPEVIVRRPRAFEVSAAFAEAQRTPRKWVDL